MAYKRECKHILAWVCRALSWILRHVVVYRNHQCIFCKKLCFMGKRRRFYERDVAWLKNNAGNWTLYSKVIIHNVGPTKEKLLDSGENQETTFYSIKKWFIMWSLSSRAKPSTIFCIIMWWVLIQEERLHIMDTILLLTKNKCSKNVESVMEHVSPTSSFYKSHNIHWIHRIHSLQSNSGNALTSPHTLPRIEV